MQLRLSILCFALALSAHADLDLTPRTRNTQFGAFNASWVQFVDGDKKYSVGLDSDTEVSAVDGTTVLRFGGIPRASVTLRRSPLRATVPFDAEGLVQYGKAALQMLPASASHIVQDEAVANPESINNGHSYRFTFTYEIGQSQMRESILFLNIDAQQQIIVQTGAFLKDFDAASGRASSIIRGWHETTPAEEAGEN